MSLPSHLKPLGGITLTVPSVPAKTIRLCNETVSTTENIYCPTSNSHSLSQELVSACETFTISFCDKLCRQQSDQALLRLKKFGDQVQQFTEYVEVGDEIQFSITDGLSAGWWKAQLIVNGPIDEISEKPIYVITSKIFSFYVEQCLTISDTENCIEIECVE